MARVYQLIKSEEEHERFEPGLVNGDWHAPIAHTGTTVCGVQLDGDDGITTGPIKDGPITCPTCLAIVSEIKAIREYRPNG